MQKATLKVNETRLVQNLRFAFTNKSTVLAELMQNGRRAGATYIRFEFDPETGTLTVVDNGNGVEDMQNLLTVAESGWDQEVKDTEHPFGMGFLSALFSATHVTIESRGKKMAFDTSHALDFGDVDVVTSDFIGGARISMVGFSMASQQIKSALAGYARGFAVDTFLNGNLLASPDREVHLAKPHIIPGVGTVKLGQSTSLEVYLQGLRVHSKGYDSNLASIVHLDSKLFYAKMPDRNMLIDEIEQIRKISDLISAEWRKVLEEEKKSLSSENFADRYWDLANKFDILDVMNDVPVIPACTLQEMSEEPSHNRWADSYLAQAKNGVAQENVESGKIVLCINAASYLDGMSFVSSMFAFKMGWIVAENLPDGHWAHKHLRDLEQSMPELTYKPSATGYFDGRFVSAEIILCDEFTIRLGTDSVAITDAAVAFGDDTNSCTILVPASSNGNEALAQASGYTEDDDYQESAYDEDVNDFTSQVQILRGEDPCVTLVKVLNEGKMHSCKNAFDKLFLVQTRHHDGYNSKDFVVDASSILKALKSALPWVEKSSWADAVAEQVRNAISQFDILQKAKFINLAQRMLHMERRYEDDDSEITRYVAEYFEEEIARGNHTIMTVSGTIKQAIEAFEGGAR